jgi:hypothetical protein
MYVCRQIGVAHFFLNVFKLCGMLGELLARNYKLQVNCKAVKMLLPDDDCFCEIRFWLDFTNVKYYAVSISSFLMPCYLTHHVTVLNVEISSLDLRMKQLFIQPNINKTLSPKNTSCMYVNSMVLHFPNLSHLCLTCLCRKYLHHQGM